MILASVIFVLSAQASQPGLVLPKDIQDRHDRSHANEQQMVALYGRCMAQVGEGEGRYPEYEPIRLVRQPDGQVELAVPEKAFNLYCQRDDLLPQPEDARIFAQGLTLEIFPAATPAIGETLNAGRFAYDAESRSLSRVSITGMGKPYSDTELDAKLAELSPAMAEAVEALAEGS